MLDKRIGRVLLDMSERLDLALYLLDETEEIAVASNSDFTGLCTDWMEELDFVEGVARVPESGFTYFLVQNENYHPLCMAVRGCGEDVERYGYLMGRVLDEILRTTVKKVGREVIFKRLLLDRMEPLELQEAVRDYRLDADAERYVIVVQTVEDDAVNVYNALIKLFPRKGGDVVVNLNRYVVALVKRVEAPGDMDTVLQLARALDETIEKELSIQAFLGVGGVKQGIVHVRDSFQEAQEAIRLGQMQQNHGRIFLFQRLLLERFLQEVPRELRTRYYDLVFSEAFQRILTDEMLTTISKFFENNLNLSEAARNLYIHRNTLIYRLEKLQRITGLDLRNFEDAVLLKIMIMLGKSLSADNTIQ